MKVNAQEATELEFSTTPETLEDFASEYKRLGRLISPMEKSRKDYYKQIVRGTRKPTKPKNKEHKPTTRKELSNGMYVLRTRYIQDGFDWEKFKEENPAIYEQYVTKDDRERITIGFIKN